MRDKAFFKVRTLTTVMVTFICTWFIAAGLLYSFNLEDQAVDFRLKNRVYHVNVIPTPGTASADFPDTAIEITGRGGFYLDITQDLPGPNYLPVVDTDDRDRRFTVAWFQRYEGNMQLCLYDSGSGYSRLLPLTGFKTAFPVRTVFLRGEPYFLVFKGNNTDNTDIFYYHLKTGDVRRITATPDSDHIVRVYDEPERFYVEIESIEYIRRFRVKKKTLSIIMSDQALKPRPERIPPLLSVNDSEPSRTIVGFGDSITYGTLHLSQDRTIDNYHPELCYLFKVEQLLEAEYGEMTTINRGVPGETSYMGLARLDTDLEGIDAYFFLTMFGTNDVTRLRFDVDEISEVLKTIVTRARDDFGMFPVISTIPPQKKLVDGVWTQQYPGRTIELNDAIIEMATANDVPYIDSYTPFFNDPDRDWVLFLEPFKGNHPGELGHDIIAALFKEQIEAAPPKPPVNVVAVRTGEATATITWELNTEWDFDHYVIEFGYTPANLNRRFTINGTSYRLSGFGPGAPFTTVIYYRILAVDAAGHTSNSPVNQLEFD